MRLRGIYGTGGAYREYATPSNIGIIYVAATITELKMTQFKKIYISYSMQRSGQHAVINRLCRKSGKIVHFNYCRFENHTVYPRYGRFLFYFGRQRWNTGTRFRALSRPIAKVSPLVFDQAFFSFEDEGPFPDLHELLERQSALVKVCIIVRDPLNWMASSLKHKSVEKKQLSERIIKYKECLKLCIDSRAGRHSDAVDINFNEWIKSESYVRQTCARLDIPYQSHQGNDVLNVGGGSSFDGTRLDGDSLKKRVQSRYMEFASNEQFKLYINDPELEELSKEYFGMDFSALK